MKIRITLLSLCLLFVFSATYSQSVKFRFENTHADSTFSNKKEVEDSISRLLTAINKAYKKGTLPDCSKVSITSDAKERLNKLWQYVQFSCEDKLNIGKCTSEFGGFQVRDIPVTVHPTGSTNQKDWDEMLVLHLDSWGRITDINFALSTIISNTILNHSTLHTDIMNRKELVKFLENYKRLFITKDSSALHKLYMQSLDLSRGSIPCHPYAEVENIIDSLFKLNAPLDISFDKVKVKRDGRDRSEDLYQLSFRQDIVSGEYKDTGYVFMLLEFKSTSEPISVMLVQWQPSTFPDGTPLAEDDILDLSDFSMP